MESKLITLHSITPQELLESMRIIVNEAIKMEREREPDLGLHISPKEAMKLLGCSKTSLWKWEKNGRIKKYGLGRKTYFKKNELIAAIKPIGFSQ